MIHFNLADATKYFMAHPNKKKWVPEQNFKNLVVKYKKEENGIKKIVTRKDGTEIESMFINGKSVKTTLENDRGTILIEENIKNNPPKNVKNNIKLPRANSDDWNKRTVVVLASNHGEMYSRREGNFGKVKDLWSCHNGVIEDFRNDELLRKYIARVAKYKKH